MELQSGTEIVANAGVQSTNTLYTGSKSVKFNAISILVKRYA